MRFGDGGDLSRRLAQAEDHFGKSLAQLRGACRPARSPRSSKGAARSAVSDLRSSRRSRRRRWSPRAHAIEQIAGSSEPVMALHRRSVDFAERGSIITDCARRGLPHRMTPARNAHPRDLLLRPRHPGRLRVAPVLPGLPVHEEQGPAAGPPPGRSTQLPRRHGPAADLQRDVRGRPADRRRLPARLSARPARDSGPGRLDRRDDAASPSAPCGGNAAQGIDITLHPPHRPHRLQGRRARGRAEGRAAASTSRSSTPTSSRPPTSCSAPSRSSPTRRSAMVQARWGHINQDYSLLTKIQSILLDGHFVLEHGGRNRAGRFFNFNGTAGIWRRDGDRRRRRLAARHADRGSRPQLPRAAARLEVRLPARPRSRRPKCRSR